MIGKPESTQLHGRWLALARLGWLAFALLITIVFVLGAPQNNRA
jgi:hypothetical protein